MARFFMLTSMVLTKIKRQGLFKHTFSTNIYLNPLSSYLLDRDKSRKPKLDATERGISCAEPGGGGGAWGPDPPEKSQKYRVS